MEYANRRGVSLSTLRRYIKAKKIQFKIENGRYLVLDDKIAAFESDDHGRDEVSELRTRLQKAQEEIAELKMLIALYEEKIPAQKIHF
jgi:hypothetical protein